MADDTDKIIAYSVEWGKEQAQMDVQELELGIKALENAMGQAQIEITRKRLAITRIQKKAELQQKHGL